MICVVVMMFMSSLVLWLSSIRPYCIRHGKGYTAGASFGPSQWIDWQEASEISKANGDTRMIRVCRLFLWLHIAMIALILVQIILWLAQTPPR